MAVQKHQMFLMKQINRKMGIMAKKNKCTLVNIFYHVHNKGFLFLSVFCFIFLFITGFVWDGNNKECKFLRARSINITS